MKNIVHRLPASSIFFLLIFMRPAQGIAMPVYGSTLQDTGAYAKAKPLALNGLMADCLKNAAAPAFSPDGKTVYFGQSSEGTMFIKESIRSGGTWSAPRPASFSENSQGLEPAYDPKGKYLVFASSRPQTDGGSKLDGFWSQTRYPGMGGNLWKVRRDGKGWLKPELLPGQINSNSSVFSPAITGDGSLYFMHSENGSPFHIYRSQMRNGSYETPGAVAISDGIHGDFDPAVAPDESFLIFSSGRKPALPGRADLFIVFSKNGHWGDPVDLRLALADDSVYGVEARLSPDLKILYFANSHKPGGGNDPGAQYIWQTNIGDLLKKHKNGEL